jgi:hypothetical protein
LVPVLAVADREESNISLIDKSVISARRQTKITGPRFGSDSARLGAVIADISGDKDVGIPPARRSVPSANFT